MLLLKAPDRLDDVFFSPCPRPPEKESRLQKPAVRPNWPPLGSREKAKYNV